MSFWQSSLLHRLLWINQLKGFYSNLSFIFVSFASLIVLRLLSVFEIFWWVPEGLGRLTPFRLTTPRLMSVFQNWSTERRGHYVTATSVIDQWMVSQTNNLVQQRTTLIKSKVYFQTTLWLDDQKGIDRAQAHCSCMRSVYSRFTRLVLYSETTARSKHAERGV